MSAKLITLLILASLLLYCQCYALPMLELHHRCICWNSRLIGHDGINAIRLVPKLHRILQQQQQQQQQRQQLLRVFSASSYFSRSNDGKSHTAPLSSLKNEEIDGERNDSFLPQKILISESSFDSIRIRKGIYVDKTKSIYQTILEPDQKYYFLVRPRRFGKSLLCSTLANLFLGKSKEELFKGLWIHDSKVWDFEKEDHPVLHLDMSKVAGVNSNVNSFEIKAK